MKNHKEKSKKPKLTSIVALWKNDQSIGFKIILNKKDFTKDIDFEGMISFLINEQEKKYLESQLKEYLDNSSKAIVYIANSIKQDNIPKLQLVEILLTAIAELYILEKHNHIQSDKNNGVIFFPEYEIYDPSLYLDSEWSTNFNEQLK
ncbi:MAG TPA: hypothetical protein VNX68_15065 [Nitrosopumilaceae archaeon]|jgi:hypothetical protein|nr:hypothetical protein [Nitrosopumilaceae archaeon]